MRTSNITLPLALLALLVGLPLSLLLVRRQFGPMLSLFRALSGTVSSYRDGDFSFETRWLEQVPGERFADSLAALEGFRELHLRGIPQERGVEGSRGIVRGLRRDPRARDRGDERTPRVVRRARRAAPRPGASGRAFRAPQR